MKTSFEKLIDSEKPILIDFTAAWCGPCKMMAPILEQVKKQVGDNARIVKIDIDKNPEIAEKMGITGVPTFMIFKKGERLWHHVGLASGQQILQELNKHASVS